MRGECGAGSFAVTGNDVHHAFGKTSFLDQLREFHRANRCLLGGFENDGVAGRQRGREFPRGHQQREIPGNDLTANADRLAQRVIEHAAGNRNRFAFDLGGPTGEVLKVLHHLRQIDVEGFFDRFTVVGGFNRGELGRVLFDQLREFVKQPAAVARAHLRPLAFERASRGSHGFVDVGLVCFRDFRERFAGGGVWRLECLSRLGIDPLSVNKKLIGFHIARIL